MLRLGMLSVAAATVQKCNEKTTLVKKQLHKYDPRNDPTDDFELYDNYNQKDVELMKVDSISDTAQRKFQMNEGDEERVMVKVHKMIYLTGMIDVECKQKGGKMFLEWNWRRGDGALCNSMKLGRAMASQLYAATSPAEMRNQTDQERFVTAKYHDLNPMSFKCRYDRTIEKQLVCRKGKWTELEKNACHKGAKACLLKKMLPHKPLNNAVQGPVSSGKYVGFKINGEKARLQCRNSDWKLGACLKSPRHSVRWNTRMNRKYRNRLSLKQKKNFQQTLKKNPNQYGFFCQTQGKQCAEFKCNGHSWKRMKKGSKKLRI